jgi:hypothetical protein
MSDPCPRCRVDRVLVGRMHGCVGLVARVTPVEVVGSSPAVYRVTKLGRVARSLG